VTPTQALQTLLGLIANGDATLNLAKVTGFYGTAIAAYQAAGAYGMKTVAPAIASVGSSPAVRMLLAQAQAPGLALSIVNTTNPGNILQPAAGLSDATTAQSLAKQMAQLYTQALAAKSTTTAVVQTSTPSSSNTALMVAGVAVAVVVSGVLVSQAHRKRVLR
jgi:hypothetical protein